MNILLKPLSFLSSLVSICSESCTNLPMNSVTLPESLNVAHTFSRSKLLFSTEVRVGQSRFAFIQSPHLCLTMVLPPPSDVETDDDLSHKPKRHGRKQRIKMMVDCEFTGEDFCNDIKAVSLVAFEDPQALDGVVLDVQKLVKTHFTVRVKLSDDWHLHANPKTVLWLRSKAPDLLRWLKSPGGLESKEAAAELAKFIRNVQSKYDIWWMSKPSHVDLGRISAWMTHHLGKEAPSLGYYGSCLQTKLQQLNKHTGLSRRIITEIILAEQQSLKAIPTHHPYTDCLAQIVAYHVINKLCDLARIFGPRQHSLRRFVTHYSGNLINESIPRLPPLPPIEDSWTPSHGLDVGYAGASSGAGAGDSTMTLRSHVPDAAAAAGPSDVSGFAVGRTGA
jgi:hypothetical protein